MEQMIFEPREMYEKHLKDKFKENALNFFNNLLKLSKVDENENKILVQKYDKLNLEKEKARKKVFWNKILITFLIILMLAGIAVGIYLLVAFIPTVSEKMEVNDHSSLNCVIGGIVSLICSGVILILLFTVLKKRSKVLKSNYDNLVQKTNQAYQNCLNQMEPLNSLYTWDMIHRLIKLTTPIITLKPQFTYEDFCCFNERYGLLENNDETESVVNLVYGDLMGNPFLLQKRKCMEMILRTYYGHLTITYTVRVSDGKGGTRTETRTQVLTATVAKPFPHFYNKTYIVYGNEGAPDLTFDRNASGVKGKNEKQIEKFVDKQSKKMDKLSREAVTEGKSFTKMSNEDFEALFGATNRDNELQFRMMFTPLAQQNMVDLLTTHEPFGDDFIFMKRNKLNYISSLHSQNFDYSCNPKLFVSHSVALARTFFVDYMCKYFENFYFDLAPLLSVPLYQTTFPSAKYEPKDHKQNLNSYEYEFIANQYNRHYLAPSSCYTDCICKTEFVSKNDNFDLVNVTANGFNGIPRIDYVPMTGADGKVHSVPVRWIEYIPVSRTTYLKCSRQNPVNEKQFEKGIDYKLEELVESMFNQKQTDTSKIESNARNFISYLFDDPDCVANAQQSTNSADVEKDLNNILNTR